MSLERPLSLCFATVLDDLVNQLSVLGKVMPVQMDTAPDAGDMVKSEVKNAIKTQQTTEEKLEAVLSARANEIKEKILVKELNDMMSLGLRGTEQTMKQSPLTKDNYAKIQEDRTFAEIILVKTQEELLERNECSYITEAVVREKETKMKYQSQIIKEEQGRHRIKELQRQIAEVKHEKEVEVQHCNEMIAHLKDQLQEMKAKSQMEAKYIKKNAENVVTQNRRKCDITEEKRTEELEALKRKIDSEERSHQEVTNYLKKHHAILEGKVEFWMNKFESDNQAKQHELTVLKTSKTNDMDRLHELLKKYTEYEKVVVHDRIEKEKDRRRNEQDLIELQSAVMLQSWWRGAMVMRKLGPFGKKKKKGRKKKGGKKKKK